jgi:hypothetical protein
MSGRTGSLLRDAFDSFLALVPDGELIGGTHISKRDMQRLTAAKWRKIGERQVRAAVSTWCAQGWTESARPKKNDVFAHVMSGWNALVEYPDQCSAAKAANGKVGGIASGLSRSVSQLRHNATDISSQISTTRYKRNYVFTGTYLYQLVPWPVS